MIDPKIYFERFLSWKRHTGGKQDKVVFDSYASMDINTLTHEMDFNVPGAIEELGERYLFGLNVDADTDKAVELFQQAAEAGHPDALQMLSEVYRTDEYGRKDLDRYFEYLTKAAEAGNWKAMFNLAVAYYKGKLAYDGHGFNMDHAATLEWSLKCDQICRALLELFFRNSCTQDLKDYFGDVYDTFVRSVFAGAKQYMDGDGTEKDPAKAKELLSSAQEFHQKYLNSECREFAFLLQKLS